MRKFKVQFLLFNNFALWIGDLYCTHNPIHLQNDLCQSNNTNKNTFTKSWNARLLSLSLSLSVVTGDGCESDGSRGVTDKCPGSS